jgi:AraC-like DNA-binding protein
MILRTAAPSPPLADLVERFWQCSDVPDHRRERILPSGTFELVMNLREDEIRIYDPLHPDRCKRYSGAVVSGPYSRPFVIDPQQHASIVGVHFKPGGAFPFLGVPAKELADTHVELESLWGRMAGELREQLCALPTMQPFSHLNDTLLSRLRQSPDRHVAVSSAIKMFARTSGTARVRDLARRIGLSERRFIQVFADEVGLTPKLYGRLQRFQQVRERLRGVETPNWAHVAVESGYFDQSHLIRDFQAFSGFSPTAFLRQRSENVLPNHVPQVG